MRAVSQIELNATDLETEDLITPQDMVVTLSHTGYMKSQLLSEYRAQRRGGRGRQAATTKDDDWIDQLFVGEYARFHFVLLRSRARLLAQGVGKCRKDHA